MNAMLIMSCDSVGAMCGGSSLGLGAAGDGGASVDVLDGVCMSAGFSLVSDVVFLLLTVTYSNSSTLPALRELLVYRRIVE